MIQMKVTRLQDTQKLVNNLVKNVPIETMDEGVSFLRDVRKAMMIRVPIDKGELKSGIGKVEKGDNFVRIVVTGKWLIQQEEGKGMPHYMPASLVKKKPHRKAKQASGSLPPKKGLVVARRYTPFVLPVLKSQIHKLNNRLNKTTKKAIKKSRGKR